MRIIAVMLAVALLLSGCAAQPQAEEQATAEQNFTQSKEEQFTDRDQNDSQTEAGEIAVALKGDTAECSSPLVKIAGNVVTICGEGVFRLSGALNGQILIEAGEQDKPRLILDGVTLQAEQTAPLYIKEADKVVITLADGSENTLQNGGSFTADGDTNIDGTLFSKQDLTLNGAGSLTVSSPAGHGIVCKDDLVFTGGVYNITCASHALDANDSVRMENSSLTAAAGKDGIHAEHAEDASLGYVYIASGSFDLDVEGDGISAGSTLQIEGGSFDILAGGGSANGEKQSSENWGGFGGGKGGHGGMGRPDGMDRPDGMGGMMRPTAAETTEDTTDSSTSMKGLKAQSSMLINGGSFAINSADDAVHSNGSITIQGGEWTLATGDDGIHAEQTLTIAEGTIGISESYEGLEALDIKVQGGSITLTATDDGLNAAGGNDSSGTQGGRDGMFGGGMGGPGGMGGGMSAGNGSILISGGTLNITASGDGIDANGTLEITGGHTTVCGPTQGDTATLDYDSSAVISGGTFIGTGAAGMAQSFSDHKQGLIAISVGNQSEGTKIIVRDRNGNTLLEHTPALSYAIMIFSSPDLQSGETYTVYVGEQSAELQAS